jgi:hypothetical protein
MISATVNGGLLSGLLVGSRSGGAINISHFLFVDDTLIFCEINLDHICNLRGFYLT